MLRLRICTRAQGAQAQRGGARCSRAGRRPRVAPELDDPVEYYPSASFFLSAPTMDASAVLRATRPGPAAATQRESESGRRRWMSQGRGLFPPYQKKTTAQRERGSGIGIGNPRSSDSVVPRSKLVRCFGDGRGRARSEQVLAPLRSSRGAGICRPARQFIFMWETGRRYPVRHRRLTKEGDRGWQRTKAPSLCARLTPDSAPSTLQARMLCD